MNLRSFSLYRNHSYPLTLSNVGEPPGVEFLGTISKYRKRNKISSLLVYVLRKTRNEARSRRSRAKKGKEMYKKAWCACKVVVLLIKPIDFLTFSLPSASLDLKVPNNRRARRDDLRLTTRNISIKSTFKSRVEHFAPYLKLERTRFDC